MSAKHRERRKQERLEKVECGECGKPAGLVDGRTLYPHRPDLATKPFWRCCVCGAYVGCHDGTFQAKGSPAGPETRQARIEAHAVFDPLWRAKAERAAISRGEARGQAYKWLAAELDISVDRCHIGMMDATTARRVVQICSPYLRQRGKT